MSKKYFIKTYGCQANKSDAERMAALFEEQGLAESDSWQDCQKLAVVTCSVRERAEQRVRAFLLKVAKYYQNSEQNKPEIIFSGCMIHHGQDHLKEILPMIDKILPSNQMAFLKKAKRKDKKHAFVPVSVGCNSFCTYCIVPYARGREKSRSFIDIMQEATELAKQGYSEITLIGQNVNSWGLEKIGVFNRKKILRSEMERKNLPNNQSQYLKPKGIPPFVELLQAISTLDEIKLIRFMSSNPWDFHDELIEEIANNQKLDRFIHLPVQSGSNSVLHRMNRGYTREDYLNLLKKLRQAAPNITLGTDLIVGFPGETEAEFADTLDLAKRANWQLAFVNIYSPRPGTSASRLYQDDVPHVIKKRRWQILDELINKKNLDQRPKVV
jgi:tRNA-2-methylthio-N6-dimethylallyladenosine synthase